MSNGNVVKLAKTSPDYKALADQIYDDNKKLNPPKLAEIFYAKATEQMWRAMALRLMTDIVARHTAEPRSRRSKQQKAADDALLLQKKVAGFDPWDWPLGWAQGKPLHSCTPGELLGGMVAFEKLGKKLRKVIGVDTVIDTRFSREQFNEQYGKDLKVT
jgi:hypothetical protein